VLVKDDFKRVKVCRMETVCKMRFKEGMNGAPAFAIWFTPLLYEEAPVVSDAFITDERQARENLQEQAERDDQLIGFTDNVPLSERNARIYGNHVTLSKARAHRAALTLQEALDLPPEAIISDGRGASTPVATKRHRAGARRQSPHRSRVLARRSTVGTAGRSESVPGRARQRSRDESLRSALGVDCAAAAGAGRSRSDSG
jgi:hypothetical protein